MNTEYIVGWVGLFEVTQMSDQILRRAMGIGGFPKPYRQRKGNATYCIWDREAVYEWLAKHPTYMHDYREKAKPKPKCVMTTPTA